MSRTQVRIEINGELAYSGWNDEPIPVAIMNMSERNADLTATIERVKALAEAWRRDGRPGWLQLRAALATAQGQTDAEMETP